MLSPCALSQTRTQEKSENEEDDFDLKDPYDNINTVLAPQTEPEKPIIPSRVVNLEQVLLMLLNPHATFSVDHRVNDIAHISGNAKAKEGFCCRRH